MTNEKFHVDVSPEMRLYKILQRQSYDIGTALAEFVDNSIQSFRDQINAIRAVDGSDPHLKNSDSDLIGAKPDSYRGQCWRNQQAKLSKSHPNGIRRTNRAGYGESVGVRYRNEVFGDLVLKQVVDRNISDGYGGETDDNIRLGGTS